MFRIDLRRPEAPSIHYSYRGYVDAHSLASRLGLRVSRWFTATDEQHPLGTVYTAAVEPLDADERAVLTMVENLSQQFSSAQRRPHEDTDLSWFEERWASSPFRRPDVEHRFDLENLFFTALFPAPELLLPSTKKETPKPTPPAPAKPAAPAAAAPPPAPPAPPAPTAPPAPPAPAKAAPAKPPPAPPAPPPQPPAQARPPAPPAPATPAPTPAPAAPAPASSATPPVSRSRAAKKPASPQQTLPLITPPPAAPAAPAPAAPAPAAAAAAAPAAAPAARAPAGAVAALEAQLRATFPPLAKPENHPHRLHLAFVAIEPPTSDDEVPARFVYARMRLTQLSDPAGKRKALAVQEQEVPVCAVLDLADIERCKAYIAGWKGALDGVFASFSASHVWWTPFNLAGPQVLQQPRLRTAADFAGALSQRAQSGRLSG